MPPLLFIDTETTGFGPCRLIDLAIGTFVDDMLILEKYRAKPPIPIEIGAQAVHHITPKMLEELPAFQDLPEYQEILDKIETGLVVLHNASFDIGVLEREGIKVSSYIDTQVLAKLLLPDQKCHQLQYLRYQFELDIDAVAHTAEGDVRVLAGVFTVLMKKLADTTPAAGLALIEHARRLSLAAK